MSLSSPPAQSGIFATFRRMPRRRSRFDVTGVYLSIFLGSRELGPVFTHVFKWTMYALDVSSRIAVYFNWEVLLDYFFASEITTLKQNHVMLVMRKKTFVGIYTCNNIYLHSYFHHILKKPVYHRYILEVIRIKRINKNIQLINK